jgi:predicted DNA-binding transcriptional regulator AlpA
VPAEILDQILNRLATLEARIGDNGGPPLDDNEPVLRLNDARVLTFREWAKLNGISQRTAWRLIASGNGPVITQLSARRIGVTIAADRAWKASRDRAWKASRERSAEARKT